MQPNDTALDPSLLFEPQFAHLSCGRDSNTSFIGCSEGQMMSSIVEYVKEIKCYVLVIILIILFSVLLYFEEFVT